MQGLGDNARSPRLQASRGQGISMGRWGSVCGVGVAGVPG